MKHKFMTTITILLLTLLVSGFSGNQRVYSSGLAQAEAPMAIGSTFTYQGMLKDGASPANGSYDFQFRLYTSSGGSQVGSTLTRDNVVVSNGLFTVELDFGASAFNGGTRTLKVSVRPGASTGSYTDLSPLQAINPAPYAQYATNAANATNATSATNAANATNADTLDGSHASGFLSTSGGEVNGPVSIGTTSHLAMLRVEATTTSRAILLSGGPTISASDLTNKWNMTPSPSGDGRLAVISANDWDTGGGFGFITAGNVAAPIFWMYGSTGRNAFTIARKNYGGDGTNLTNLGSYLVPLFQVRENGNVGIGTTNPTARLEVKGVIRVVDNSLNPVVEIGPGLDYAESFDLTDKEKVQPGMVVVIDPDNPGQLMLSTQAYDAKVAGVIAGANGLGSGVRLGESLNGLPVALAGRVYCYVDASSGDIQPGDLLTTSAIPGYAMKVSDPSQAQGAILGKAMGALKKGLRGLILVLVTLQ